MVINNSNWRMYHCNSQGKRLPIGGETTNTPSKTVPGQQLSLRQLIERYSRGAHVEVFEGSYSTDPTFDNMERLDKVERLEAAKQVKQSIADARARRASSVNGVPTQSAPPADSSHSSLDV